MLVFALKKLKLGEPLMDSVGNLRPTGVVLVLDDLDVCVEGVEVRLLALAGGNRLDVVIANVFPRTGAISQRISQEVGAGEVGWAASKSEIDLLIAPRIAFADLVISW